MEFHSFRKTFEHSYETVIKICNLLHLKQVYDSDLTVFNEHGYEICTMLAALDEQAVHTIKTILSIEYERCTEGRNVCKSIASKSLDYEEANA